MGDKTFGDGMECIGDDKLREGGRALSPEEKRLVVERIHAAWLTMPALRLGQLIVNAMRPIQCPEIFYVEDGALAERVEALVSTNTRRSP
jgi:hypothetical protein